VTDRRVVEAIVLVLIGAAIAVALAVFFYEERETPATRTAYRCHGVACGYYLYEVELPTTTSP
jgi:hypothetical protein